MKGPTLPGTVFSIGSSRHDFFDTPVTTLEGLMTHADLVGKVSVRASGKEKVFCVRQPVVGVLLWPPA
uniref:Uncharacterized protein n=1 Tax=Chromera velia CCMP2878 TaxID=1169474 RepID=A0A0G4ICE4_9ALVE|eukprot:Cvel_13089.t1-p1 / transcript=Cvel_13089.t1 / gene=Cvel_13089 / organism=Chromera_velia_CCMP2878 / gene_product=hypothetical protein / transcript_product=hypothetical protein / location=Cvel_scaffold881:55778-56081(-) / protein_length=67 / sequence_SO=supercontig / SO=protein_coding / is_pseudo=false